MGKYVTKAKLKKMLGDKYDLLETNAIDYGSSFVSGQVTSAFAIADNALHIGSLASQSSTVLALLNNHELEKDVLENIGQSFTQTIVEQVSSTAAEMITSKVIGLVPTTSELTSYISHYYQQNVKSVADILKEENIGIENNVDKDIEHQQNNIKQNSLSNINKDIAIIKSDANKVNNFVTTNIGKVLPYISAGPDWIVNQLDNITANSVKKVYDVINEGAKPIYNKRSDIIKHVCETEGKSLAEKQNNLTRKAIHQQLGTQKEIIVQTKIKSQIQIQKAKIKVLSLIGMK